MNKNLSSLNDKLEENARLGMAYARAIDSASQKLKRRKNIRKSVSMPKTKM
jgi:predicted ATP-grasp superfamily ATP-dependent carboligase